MSDSAEKISDKSTTGGESQSLSIAALIMMGSVLLSRVIGLFREMILADYGGTSYEMDAYVTSFIIPELLNHFLAGGFLSITFIPIFQKHLVNNREDLAWRSFSNLFIIGTMVFGIIIPITVFLVPGILKLLGPQINDPQSFPLTVRLTRIILPAQLLFYWGALLSAVQMAQKKFFLPALAPLGYNLGIILGGILFGTRYGIEGFAWGVVGGAFFGNFLLQIPGAISCGMRLTAVCDFRDPDLYIYIKKTLPLILGLGMTFSNEIFFRYFGSYLPEGATSSVNYALRTTMMLVAMFGQASGVAFYPFMTKLAAERKFAEMEQLLHSVLKKIALYLLPLSAVFFVLAQPIIVLLYQRGRFNFQSSIETTAVFTVYLTGAFSFSAYFIVARAFYAMQNMILPMLTSTVMALITVPMYFLFSRFFGARGIALAAVAGSFLQCGILYGIWAKRHGSGSMVREMGMTIGKIVLCTVVGAVVGILSYRWCGKVVTMENRIFDNGLKILCIAPVMICCIFFLYDRFGIQRFRESLTGLLKRK
ncbi:MAG: murein biosynthesis integral membrane protein MurJ [Chitinispirillaceae bacterium]|nr:murein biosynthesis integral membrane protein MurJ [Chitinispirillaceae bacterium]